VPEIVEMGTGRDARLFLGLDPVVPEVAAAEPVTLRAEDDARIHF
jgi:hypothetical protein